MSFQDTYKITAEDRQNKGVSGLPDTPNMTTAAIQERFDSLGNLSIDKFNALVDAASDTVDGSEDKFPTNKAVSELVEEMGGGDMLRAVYDTDRDGTVDNAENSVRLNGHFDTYFGTSESVVALTQALDVERARIDEIASLPEGSTSGDAELMDIRVGENGKTYPSAGNSVREQFKDTHNIFNEQLIPNNTINLFNKYAISNYYAYNSAGSLRGDGTATGQAPNTFVSDWIPVSASTKYYYNNYGARITEFDSSKVFVNNISPTNTDNFTTTATTAYVRFTISNTSANEDSFVATLYDDKPNDYVPFYDYTLNERITVPQLNSIYEFMEDGYGITSGKYWTIESDVIVKKTYANLNAVDAIPIKKGDKVYIYTKGAASGYSYYITDSDSRPLTYSTADEVNQIITITDDDAALLYINVYVDYLEKFKIAWVNNASLNDIVLNNKSRIDNYRKIVICCTGDSVTQGMATDGSSTADYGKEPYPAQLTTMLVDNGYTDYKVYNQGHGGECLPDVAARLGGRVCYFSEDVSIPGDGSWVSLGTKTISDHQVKGTKLKINYKNKDNEDYNVYFTQLSSDTNPIYIDGIEYEMKIESDTDYIKKVLVDNKTVVIKAGTALYTNDRRNPQINIIFAGYNCRQSLTLEKWLELNKNCADVNGGKYIIIGSTIPIWETWTDVIGDTADKRYSYYKNRTYDVFGVHFLDLYTDFFDHALPYALEAGYFSTLTEEELDAMAALLSNRILPAEFSYDGEHEGNVHLNAAGYYVVARLLFDKLKRLNYITL